MYYKLEISRILEGATNPFFHNEFTFNGEEAKETSYKYLAALTQTQKPYKNSYIVLKLGSVEFKKGLIYNKLEKITIENAVKGNK